MKKTIAIITAGTLLLTSAAVLADTTISDELLNKPASTYAPGTMPTPEIQGDIMLINGNPDASMQAPVNTPSYISNTVTVTEITDTAIATTLKKDDAENPENTINYTLNENTIVLGYANGDVKSLKDIKKGDQITVFSNSYAPAPLIMPPQYQADVIFVEDNLELNSLRKANVDTYFADNETMINAANNLVLNIADDTEIVDRKGGKVDKKDLDKKDLAVIYSIETRSIPAQTNPHKIVVLGENEMALKQIEAAKTETTPAPEITPEATAAPENEIDFTKVSSIGLTHSDGNEFISNFYPKENTMMVPLRSLAEGLGYTVEWDGETKSIYLNGGIYSLKIGENAYGVGKMMPQPLSFAPEIGNDDLTYVPFEYFTEILGAKSNVKINDDGAQIITFDAE